MSVVQSKCCLAEFFWFLSLEFGRSWSMKHTEGDVINGMNSFRKVWQVGAASLGGRSHMISN